MELEEAIALIQADDIIQNKPTIWADLGCGSGLFTRALSGLLYSGSTIYAVDKSISSFQKKSFSKQVVITTIESDFVKNELNLENLDGILMANSFHFVRDKKSFIEKMIPYFSETPVFLLVEYDTDLSNPWVPYPVSFMTLRKFFTDLGFTAVKKINEKKSLYRSGNMYSVIVTR